MTATSTSARYRFGDAGRAGVLLGLGMRQALPLVLGVLWLTLCSMIGVPVVGVAGPVVGAVVSLGRWRHAPLYEVAVPGIGLWWMWLRRRGTWVRRSLLAAGPGLDDDLPSALSGLELVEVDPSWPGSPRPAGAIRDRPASTVSMVLRVSAAGFPVASLREQDALVSAWGAVLAPLARPRCPVARVTWQEWCRPVGVDAHSEFLATLATDSSAADAAEDYRALLEAQAPATIAHEVLVTLTVDLRRVRATRGRNALTVGIDALGEEARLFLSRGEAAGMRVEPVGAKELAAAVRMRSDPRRAVHTESLRAGLAAAARKGSVEWGPMAVEPDWFQVRVDGSVHRSYRIVGWPMLPVPADWLGPLMTGDAATRTVTVVMEPVSMARAAQDANRQLTSIEADQQQKERHGFRLTARELRRHADVEAREQELVSGHPEFRHVGFVTVTAPTISELDDAASDVEQSAAQALLDLRPLAARQAEGWVASLPLGRSVRAGAWS